jgi:glycerate dehydrogenase
MKILFLDGFTLFQKDLDRSIFEKYGEVIYHDRTSREELKKVDPTIEVISTNKCPIGADDLCLFPNLKLILVSATGYNIVDVQACTEKGIHVCNVPNYGTFSVAQHALAMLLNYSNQVDLHEKSVKRGEWSSNQDFSYTLSPIREWHGKTLGVIGMGNIGQAFAGMAESLGMQVIYHHTKDLNLVHRKFVHINELASTSDVISLHCPLTTKTDKMINSEFLSLMKSSSILINTSRGGLIHSLDLKSALVSGQISAALLDVLEVEPPAAGHPLIGIPNAIITPHIAWISLEARKRIVTSLENTLSMYLKGTLVNCVNPNF